MALLYLFVTLITVDSGLMYQVVSPAFDHHTFLVSIYWALPYVVSILLIKKLPETVSRSYVLYAAITMIGFSFILFYLLDDSAMSYLLINALMLGAFGICDLFWWTMLGELLAFTRNPVRLFGIGLSANLLGVLIGSLMGVTAFELGSLRVQSATVAVVVVFLSLLFLPILYNNLSLLIQSQAFLAGLFRPREQTEAEEAPRDHGVEIRYDAFGLTGREREIADLLLQGATYRMVASELFISENTVKTHIKNIYAKFSVTTKTEFLQKIKE